MKFTISWLKEHLDTEATVEQIIDVLSDIGLEVEKVNNPYDRLLAFTIGHVLKAEQHPNADKLRVCTVDTNDGEKQIICGAPNARAGIKVVIAKPGSYIPGIDTTIGVGNIRGIESAGMLCSEREMGLSDEHDGIIELPSGKVGQSFVDWLTVYEPEKIDAVIEIGITPNRPDALGVRGIARDLAARGLGSLKEKPANKVIGKFKSNINVAIDTEIKNSGCRVFMGRYIRNLRNGPSPKWLQDRLLAIGLRPISSLVDITNFFTFDRNRPLHVFDADKLVGSLKIHKSTKGQSMMALDDKEYELPEGSLAISDSKGLVSIAGIMGGLGSGCTEATVNVFLEAAVWDTVQIAITGRILKINSDARYRNERGIDPEFNEEAIELATKMIIDICGGEPSDIVSDGKIEPVLKGYKFDRNMIKSVVGMDVPTSKQEDILEKLGFRLDNGYAYPPSWRPDITGEIDLVEEIARISSLTKLVSSPLARLHFGVQKSILTAKQNKERIARREIASLGYNECVTYTFIDRSNAVLFGGVDAELRLENPISQELSHMRPDLLPGLLMAASRNQARGFMDLRLFEVGAVFNSGEPEGQYLQATGLLVGHVDSRNPHNTRRLVDIFDVKSDAEAVLFALKSPSKLNVHRDVSEWWHPGRSGCLALGAKKTLGTFGEIHPRIIKKLGLKGAVVAFTILVEFIPERRSKATTRDALKISDLQGVERDFAFILNNEIESHIVVSAARSADKELIETVNVFDEFKGPQAEAQFGKGKKSLAISVKLQPKEVTFKDVDIEAISLKIIAGVIASTGGELRR